MKKTFLSFCTFSILLASCAETSLNEDESNLANGLPAELTLNVGIDNQGSLSRAAVNSTAFSAGSELGLFAVNAGSEALATNLKTTSANGTSWTLASPVSISDLDGTVEVYAYYPYSAIVADVTAIPVTVAASQFETESDNQIDYMYGSATVIRTSPCANITMHHALAEVSFTFNNVSYAYDDAKRAGIVSGVKLSNNSTANVLKAGAATLNAKTGTLAMDGASASDISVASNVKLFDSNNKPIASSEAVNLLLFPVGSVAANDIKATVTIDGQEYSAVLPAVSGGYMAGNRYAYPINIKLIKPSADGTGYTDAEGNPTDGEGNSLTTRTDDDGNTIFDYTYADGSPLFDSEGNMLYPDGTKVSDDPTNPENHLDGNTTYSNGKPILDADGNMLYPDGTSVKTSNGDQVGNDTATGSVGKDEAGVHTQYLTYADGSRVVDEEGNLLYPDGTKVSDDPEHPEDHLNGNTHYSNGQPILDADGNMLYPDGTNVITSTGDKVGSDGASGTVGQEQTEGHTGAGTSPDAENAVFVRISIGTVSIAPWQENTQDEINLVIGEQ